MSAQEFRDTDSDYLNWIAAHPDGFVINIRRSHTRSDARLHHAGCRTIRRRSDRALTDQYVKVCSIDLAELERWASDHAGGPITRCGTCHAARDRSTDPAAPHAVAPGQASTRSQVRAGQHWM